LSEHPEFKEREEYIEEMKKAVEDPDYVVSGWHGEYLAVRFSNIAPGRPKYLCVVYRELDEEGFVITAFFISRLRKLLKRGIAWKRA